MRRESSLVVSQNFLDRDHRKAGQTERRRASAAALLADIAEREPETRLAIVFLFGDDPVEADHAVAEVVQRGSPQLRAEASSAVLALTM